MSNLAWLATGLLAAGALLAALLWSIVFPMRRVWPPKTDNVATKAAVWGLTILVFASAVFLGILDWNSLGWPAWFRWGAGLPLIVAGNIIVWTGVAAIGLKATSGDRVQLKTEGPYRYSRNPQYVADIAILLGWFLLSASLSSLPVVAAGILALAIAPFAEEPWLRSVYGTEFDDYMTRTRRYF